MLEELATVMKELSEEAATRTFGTPDPEKRMYIQHGYLLALEDVTVRIEEFDLPKNDPNDPMVNLILIDEDEQLEKRKDC